MKISYESKSVLMSWKELSILSDHSFKELTGVNSTIQSLKNATLNGKMGNLNDGEKIVSYSNTGVIVKYLKCEKLSVEEFYNMLPVEVVALQINLDFYSAATGLTGSELEEELGL